MQFFQNTYVQIVFSSIIVYIFVVVAIRLFGKKELSQLSVIDLVFILLISNAVQNAMVLSNPTLEGGLIAAATLFLVNFILKNVMYHFPKFGKLVQGHPIMLVYKGKMNEKNMRKAKITADEIDEAIREHGVEGIKNVDLAILEVDGNISVLSDEFRRKTTRKRKAHRAITKQQ
ncbi:MAG: DUF421 domain-containing protein [Bacillota bacterium]|nr:DUF421 domain-containing protein [Bacillota bacterium]